jgi:hypothetical protein
MDAFENGKQKEKDPQLKRGADTLWGDPALTRDDPQLYRRDL